MEKCGKAGCRIPAPHRSYKVDGKNDYMLKVTHPDYVEEAPPVKERRKTRLSKVDRQAAKEAKAAQAAQAAGAEEAKSAGPARAAAAAAEAGARPGGRSMMPKLPIDDMKRPARSMMPDHVPGAPMARKPPPSPRAGDDADLPPPASMEAPPPPPEPPAGADAAAQKPRNKPVFRSI